MCRLTILALERLDWRGRLRPLPLQAFREERPTRDELLATLHLRDADGDWARGGDAALRIAAAVPVLWPLAVVGRLPGGRLVADAGYRLIAEHRQAISGVLSLDACAPHLRLRGGVAAPRRTRGEGGPKAALASV